MDISFSGIKNPAYLPTTIHNKIKGYIGDTTIYSERIKINYLNMELTDDFNGKDLTEYRKNLKSLG